MPLIYYKPDGSWTCGSCGRPHAQGDAGCECSTPRVVEDAEPATDGEVATARRIVENVPNHGFVSVPARLLARIVRRASDNDEWKPKSVSERLHRDAAQVVGCLRFFAVELTGERTEITDLYWFEEQQIHTLDEKGPGGVRVEVTLDGRPLKTSEP